MDKSIYNKLTESAKTALDETTREVTELIIEKAYQNAIQNNTADKEISLSDIIEAKEEILYRRTNISHKEFRKKGLLLMLSMTGAFYSMFGIIIYLYQNKSFDIATDIGLIIAALGLLISIIAFYYSKLMTARKVELFKGDTVITRDYSEFEIIRRWQTIEKYGTDLMLRDGVSETQAKSFSFLLNYLSEAIFDNLKKDDLRKLLKARNRILHGSTALTKGEIEEMIKTADDIIDELERQRK